MAREIAFEFPLFVFLQIIKGGVLTHAEETLKRGAKQNEIKQTHRASVSVPASVPPVDRLAAQLAEAAQQQQRQE